MRILSVANVPPKIDSGAAGTVIWTNAALRELGHVVDEIWQDDLGTKLFAHGNLHSLIEQPRKYRSAILRATQSKTYDLIISQQPQSYLAARDHRRKNRPGLFLTFSQGVENQVDSAVSRWRNRLDADERFIIRRIASRALRALLSRQWPAAVRYSDGVIVQHSQDQEYLSRLPLKDISPVGVCPSGLSRDYLATPINEMTDERLRRIIFVGQFAFYKGVYFLAEIVNRLLAGNDHLSFTWVCACQDHDQASRMFDKQIRRRVRFLDWMPQQELINVYDSHGILIFPTIAEGFAKVPLEAMSRGLCVVSSNCCGMRDYIDNEWSGFLFEVGDLDQFVAGVEQLLQDLDKSREISNRAVEAASVYTWQYSAQSLLDFAAAISSRNRAAEC